MRKSICGLGAAVFLVAVLPSASYAAFLLPTVEDQKYRDNFQNVDGLVVHDGTVKKADGSFVPAGTIELIGYFQLSSPLVAQGTVVTPSEFKVPGGPPVADDVTVPTGGTGVEEVLGLVYDLRLFSVWDESAGAFVAPGGALATGDILFFDPLGRNPLPDGASAIAGSGGVAEIYIDAEIGVGMNFQVNAGLNTPTGWAFGAGGAGGRDTYTAATQGDIGITSDTRIIGSVFQNLVGSGIATFTSAGSGVTAIPGAAVFAFVVGAAFNAGPSFTGKASTDEIYANLDVLGGTQAFAIKPGGMAVEDGTGAVVGSTDIRLDTQAIQRAIVGNMGASGTSVTGSWDVTSDDPIEFVSRAIPEPVSLLVWAGLFGGFAGLARIRRRKAA